MLGRPCVAIMPERVNSTKRSFSRQLVFDTRAL